MADIKTNQERDELFRRIYKIATDLVHAGHVSEWDFKSYVLGTMFYRYISENFAAYVNEGEHAAGNQDFDYARMSDEDAEPAREGLVQEKGFFILPSELFCNVRARADQDENLNETLERVFAHIESSAASGDAENDFAGLFDDYDVNSKSIGETVAKRNKVLAELLDGVAQMPLYDTGGINPDLFGDAYEYLMSMYAANAGKKGGQYFTPADVSELLARLGTIGKTRINKVYDPACGSGSLLLKVEKVLGKDNIERGFFGQEIDLTTYNLCRINMFLHMSKYSIETFDDLYADRERLQGEMDKLIAYRTKLQNKIRRASPAEKETLRQEKSGVTERITELRKQLKLNKGIEERSLKIQEKTDLLYANEYRAKEAEQNRKSQRKERDAR